MPADRAPSVLITGIHSELGFAVSHRFRSEGWFVIGCDHGTATGRNVHVRLVESEPRSTAEWDDATADMVWAAAGLAAEGHRLSFAHAH